MLILTENIRENKRLAYEVDKLQKEIQNLKSSDPRLKLRNIIIMNAATFERYDGIKESMVALESMIRSDIASIDTGFALSIIDLLERNISKKTKTAVHWI